MKSVEVPPVASRQSGVFTAEQALASGWSERQVRRRLTEKTWTKVAGGGLVAAGAPRTPQAVGWAIRLTLPAAVVSHVTAGTAADCLAVLPRSTALSLLAWATTRKVVTTDDLAAAIDRYRGRSGVDQLRRLADICRRGAPSVAESLCHEVLDRVGITGWEANVPVSDADGLICVADVVFARGRVILEVDGWAAHGSREAFVRDRRVQARLVAAGWVVLRITWSDLSGSGKQWVELLRRTLAARSAA